MGAFLEKPKTEKTTSHGSAYGISYGVSTMQGWRLEMEDAHVCGQDIKRSLEWSVFGVFDGHAGAKVSKYCAEHLVQHIIAEVPSEDQLTTDNIKKAISGAFSSLDSELRRVCNDSDHSDHSGTTAVVVLITPTHIFWANCGDSRGLLCREGKLFFATQDHKPYNELERVRIEKAGGTVMMQRVNGSLAVSRALGDFDYKKAEGLRPEEQLVSPEPDITITERSREDEFLVLACDGIYDVMSNDEVIGYISRKLLLEKELHSICSDLLDTCLNKNSRDNMSVILVTFPGAPKVSQKAIEEEKRRQKEATEKIYNSVERMVEAAHEAMEVEEHYVMQQLEDEFPNENDIIVSMRSEISEKLQTLTKEKFGEQPSMSDDHSHGLLNDDFPVDEQLLQGGISPMKNEDFSFTGSKEGGETALLSSPRAVGDNVQPDTT